MSGFWVAIARARSDPSARAVELVELLKVDLISRTIARPLHLPEMIQRADRGRHIRLDLHGERLRLELPERGCAGHAVQHMHLAVNGLQLDARRRGEIVSGQLVLNRMARPQRRQSASERAQILAVRRRDKIEVPGGADDTVRSRRETADEDIADAGSVQSGNHCLGLKPRLGQPVRRP